ncbi:MAG TPA: FUSC family protein, partial [Acetobacteraceae bacterium]|nr:FUSC family protein [Acetobacteraceae bacterium]
EARAALLAGAGHDSAPALALISLAALAPAAPALFDAPDPEPAALPAPATQPPAPPRTGLLPTTRVAIQALVAASITTALDLGVGLNHAYWATLTVMVVLGTAYGETVARARSRVIGTGLGVLAAMAATLALAPTMWILAAVAVPGLAVALVMAKRNYALASAAIGFAVVVGLHLVLHVDLASMLARIYESVIGAAAALLAARFVLPIYATDPVVSNARAFVAQLRDRFAELWPYDGPPIVPPGAERLDEILARVLAGLPAINAEALLGRRPPTEIHRLASLLHTMTFAMTLVQEMAARLAASAPDAELRQQASLLREWVLQTSARVMAGEPYAAPPPIPPSMLRMELVEYSYFCDTLVATAPKLVALLRGETAPAARTPVTDAVADHLQPAV